jgi:hypothetical protein
MFSSASKGHVDCVRILNTNGAKLNIRDKVIGLCFTLSFVITFLSAFVDSI